jgi:formylmethanofuran dehydrogenase subunit E-like metal-binding protein
MIWSVDNVNWNATWILTLLQYIQILTKKQLQSLKTPEIPNHQQITHAEKRSGNTTGATKVHK